MTETTSPPVRTALYDTPLPPVENLPPPNKNAERRPVQEEILPPIDQTIDRLRGDICDVLNVETLPATTAASLALLQKTMGRRFEHIINVHPEITQEESVRSYGWENYLKQRAPEGCRTNFFTGFTTENILTTFPEGTMKQYELAAKSIVALLEHYHMSISSNLPAAVQRVRTPEGETILQEMSMEQHTTFLGTSVKPKDTLAEVIPADKTSNHVVVIKDGCLYKIETTDVDGSMYSIEHIFHELLRVDSIHTDRLKSPMNDMVPSLSGAPKRAWEKVYQLLESDPVNKDILNTIEKAQFVVCLDKPDTDTNDALTAMQRTLRNGGKDNWQNRYHGKNQLIISNDGTYIGFEWNHIITDGSSAKEIQNDVEDRITTMTLDEKRPAQGTAYEDEVTVLEWNKISLGDNKNALDHAETKLKRLLDSQTSMGYTFDFPGKKLFKDNDLSPDAMMQIVFLAATAELNEGQPLPAVTVVNCRAVNGRVDMISPFSPAVHSVLRSLQRLARLQEPLEKLGTSIAEETDLKEGAKKSFKTAESDIIQKIQEVREGEGVYAHLMAVPAAVFDDMRAPALAVTAEQFSSRDPNLQKVFGPTAVFSNGGVRPNGVFGTAPSRRDGSQGTLALGYSTHEDKGVIDITAEGPYSGTEQAEKLITYIRKYVQIITDILK